MQSNKNKKKVIFRTYGEVHYESMTLIFSIITGISILISGVASTALYLSIKEHANNNNHSNAETYGVKYQSKADLYSEKTIDSLKGIVLDEYNTLISITDPNSSYCEYIKLEYTEFENACNSNVNNIANGSELDRIIIATSYFAMEINLLDREFNQYNLKLSLLTENSDEYIECKNIINNLNEKINYYDEAYNQLISVNVYTK